VNLFEVTGGFVKILKSALALSVLLTMLVACGDDSSSSVSPDSGASISDGNESSSSNKDGSSSSQKNSKNSSSSVDKKSSSSEQGNSSVGGKSSSSSAVESSSGGVLHICDDGDTLTKDRSKTITHYICENNNWVVKYTVRKDSLDSLAAIEKNKEHPNMDSLFAGYDGEYFEFEDPRDGHKYKYIEFHGYTDDIGSHATFYVMAENLNYGKMVPSGTTKFDDKVTEKLCYVDDEWFCDNHFGGLYSWAEAMNLPKVCDSVEVGSNDACKVFADSARSEEKARTIIWQGICPDGWHIMNKREWIYTNGDLRSSILWEKNAGRNTDGLAVIPTGNGYAGIHEYAYMWLPMADSITYTVTSSFTLSSKKTSIIRWVRDSFQSIRCVMDANNTLTED
jgi:uncharacterized protein (TIGR02145 family)